MNPLNKLYEEFVQKGEGTSFTLPGKQQTDLLTGDIATLLNTCQSTITTQEDRDKLNALHNRFKTLSQNKPNNLTLPKIVSSLKKACDLVQKTMTAPQSNAQTVLERQNVEQKMRAAATTTVQRPIRDNPLNQGNVEEWIKQHPSECQPAARILAKSVKHISQAEFEKSFSKTVSKFNEMASKPGFEYVVVTEDNKKSNEWMTQLATPQLVKKPKGKVPFVYSGYLAPLAAKALRGEKVEFPKNIVLFDDAIYSAEQMSKTIKEIHKAITVNNANLKKNGKAEIPFPNIVIACPYVTHFGEQKLAELSKSLGMNIQLLDHEVIPTVSEGVTATAKKEGVDGGEILKTLNKMYWPKDKASVSYHTYEEGAESRGLVYFSHKIPDDLSFPDAFAHGDVMNINGEKLEQRGYRLIPTTVPPYKPQFAEFAKEIQKIKGAV